MSVNNSVQRYEMLWSQPSESPYETSREREVAAQRFGPVFPYLEARADIARAANRHLRVLDFGCADGLTAAQILGPLEAQVEYLGSDVYPLEQTAQRMTDHGFRVQVSTGGVSHLPNDWRDLDIVMGLSCFQYIQNTAATFADLAARLASGGVFIGYFYDAAPLRRVSDNFLRELFGDPGAEIERLEPLAKLFASLRDATRGREVAICEGVPELGIPAGTVPLQQFLIDYVAFAWAPEGATTRRIQWALAELLTTGPHTYLDTQDIDRLLGESQLMLLERVSGSSGHLVVAERQQ